MRPQQGGDGKICKKYKTWWLFWVTVHRAKAGKKWRGALASVVGVQAKQDT